MLGSAVTVVGHLTDDPDINYDATGVTVAGITIACAGTIYPAHDQTGNQRSVYLRGTLRQSDAQKVVAPLKRGTKVVLTAHITERICTITPGRHRALIELDIEDIGICLTGDPAGSDVG